MITSGPDKLSRAMVPYQIDCMELTNKTDDNQVMKTN